MSRMTVRLSRAAQVERNRERVLDAAREVFLVQGYAGATLDAIAEQAGFSKGVVYSQFAGKADLFLALLERRITERAAENARLVARHAGVEALRALLQHNARHSTGAADWARLLIEFRLVAARDPELNARYSALHERTVAQFAETLTEALARDGLAPVYPPHTFARVVLALDVGAVVERAATPDALPPELAEDIFARLVGPR
jgi:AcrR family transcriptional regulator